MVMIANLQYGWTYFVDPIDARYHWGRASIQVAFTIFVATETWLVPIEGWFVDRFGPRIVVMFGGDRRRDRMDASTRWRARCRCCMSRRLIAGVGAGAVYGTCVGNALKWFADRRGFAAGLTAAGFGAGAAATVVPIVYVITPTATTARSCGSGSVRARHSGAVAVPQGAKAGRGSCRCAKEEHHTSVDATSGRGEMLRTPLFWILYVMFVTGGGERPGRHRAGGADRAGLQNCEPAGEHSCSSVPTVLVMAGIVDNILNGLARPTFGWVSDHIGRENTMAIVFTFGAGAYWALGTIGNTPWTFIVTAGLVYFTWGEIYSLFPAHLHRHIRIEVRDDQRRAALHGERHGVVLVPAASWLQSQTGSWHAVFVVAAIANIAVARDGVVRGQADARRATRRIAVASAGAGSGRDEMTDPASPRSRN